MARQRMDDMKDGRKTSLCQTDFMVAMNVFTTVQNSTDIHTTNRREPESVAKGNRAVDRRTPGNERCGEKN